jgi:Rha family phage regulatory protein
MQLQLNLPNSLAAREALFLSTDGQPLTTSRAVAERFGKRHCDVLTAIKNLLAACPDPTFAERNFAFSKYQVTGGKNTVRDEVEYRLSRDGFALLAMGFTGREALAWKIAFLSAFNAIEAQLAARTARYVAALDAVRPCLRPVVEATEQGLSRAVIATPLGKSPAAITYHRRAARCLGLLGA